MSQLSLPPFSRRSLLTGLGAGVTGLGLAACGAPGGGDDDADAPVREGYGQADVDIPSEYSDRTPILFWAPFTGENFEAVQRQFQRFNESQDDIVAVAESQGSYDDMRQKLTAALQAQSVPDIVALPGMQWMAYYVSNALVPLDEYFDDDWNPDIYIDPFAKEYVAAGSTYLVPFARSTPIFYYNKDLYRQAGLPEEGPTTWNDLADFGPELAKIDVGGQSLATVVFGGGDASWQAQGEIWGFGGAYSKDFEVTINDERGVECFEFQRKFIHDDGFGYLAQEPTTDFTTGPAAGVRASTASLTGITSEASFEVGCAFLPGQINAPTQVPTGGSGLAIVRSDSKERQDACAELFRFLAQPEVAAEWHRDTGYLPIVEASHDTEIVRELVAENPNYGVALDQLEYAQVPDRAGWVEENTSEVGQQLLAIYGDNVEVQSTLDNLAETLQDNLDESREDIEKLLGSE